MGSIGDCYDNAMIESFWGRVQTELLDRRRWRTRLELANALFEYLEMFHNRRRRHTALGMLTPDRVRTPTRRDRSRSLNSSNLTPPNGGRIKVSGQPGDLKVTAWSKTERVASRFDAVGGVSCGTRDAGLDPFTLNVVEQNWSTYVC